MAFRGPQVPPNSCRIPSLTPSQLIFKAKSSVHPGLDFAQ